MAMLVYWSVNITLKRALNDDKVSSSCFFGDVETVDMTYSKRWLKMHWKRL